MVNLKLHLQVKLILLRWEWDMIVVIQTVEVQNQNWRSVRLPYHLDQKGHVPVRIPSALRQDYTFFYSWQKNFEREIRSSFLILQK